MNRYTINDPLLNADSFIRRGDNQYRPIVGLFGEQGQADPASFRLPQYDAARMGMLTEEELRQLAQQARQQYANVEQQFAQSGRQGPMVQNGDGQDIMGNDPLQVAALTAIREGRTNAEAELARREAERRMQQNQLLGGIVEAGYDFAPGSLNDPTVVDAVWQGRNNLPGLINQQVGADAGFLRRRGDGIPFGMAWQRGPIEAQPRDPMYGDPLEGDPMYSGPAQQDMVGPFQLQRPVFDMTPRQQRTDPMGQAPAGRSSTMSLRPGVGVRNPFSTSVATTRPRTPFA